MKNITIQNTSYIVIFISSIIKILYKNNWYLSNDLDGRKNSSPNAHFRFSNFVLRKQKLQNGKWQCSQNLDLNPANDKGLVCSNKKYSC